MIFKIDIKSIIILILILIIIFLQKCQSSGTSIEKEIVTETEIVYETVEVEKEVYIPKYKEKIVNNFDTLIVKEPIDTLEILKDYYSKYYYQDTISLDTLGYLVINDTITQNKIYSRDFKSKINVPTTFVTNTIYLNKYKFFMGPSMTFDQRGFDDASWELLIKDKKDRVYTLGLGVNRDGNTAFTGGIKFRLE